MYALHGSHRMIGMTRSILTLLLIAAIAVTAQMPRSRTLPPQILIPGAPTVSCNFPSINANDPIRITVGDAPIPYQFACGHNRPIGVCAIGTLPPGLIVNLGAEQGGWACVTGGDSTSGWIPAEHLAQVPANPHVPLTEWLGWWRQGNDVKGETNDRLLITRHLGLNVLHVSGRALWYGLNGVVHSGMVQADGTPIGIYLHAVASPGGCVVDLKLDPHTHTLQAYDNMQCGGANVRFDRTWNHFTPKRR